jgi:hypothetical protein
MSLLDLLGAHNTVEQVHSALNDIVVKLDPLLRDVENRLGGIGESLLDRIDGATITIPEIKIQISLKPIPKAKTV